MPADRATPAGERERTSDGHIYGCLADGPCHCPAICKGCGGDALQTVQYTEQPDNDQIVPLCRRCFNGAWNSFFEEGGMSSDDPTGAARTAEPELDETERTLEQRGERDMLDLIRRVRRLQHAATLSHLAGQAGPEVEGLVDALMSPTAEGTIEMRTALLAAYAAKDAELAQAVAALRADEDGPDDDLVGLSLIWIGGEEMHDRFLAWYKPEDWPLGRHRAASAFLREELAALRQQRDEAVAAKEVAESIRDVGYKIRRYVSFVLTGDEEADVQVAAERAKDRIAALEAEAASERQRAERAEAAIAFLRDGYSSYGARACPACVYENGKFIRLCKVHEEAAAERQRAEDARGRLALISGWLAEADGLDPIARQLVLRGTAEEFDWNQPDARETALRFIEFCVGMKAPEEPTDDAD